MQREGHEQGAPLGVRRAVEGAVARVSVDAAVFRDGEAQARTVGDIHARSDEGEQVTRVVEIEIQAVGDRRPFGVGGLAQGRKFFPDSQFLNVLHHGEDGLRADVGPVGELRGELDPVDVVVGVGLDGGVADVVPSVRILEDDVGHADVADQVLVADIHEIGVRPEGDLRLAPLVDIQGMQVGIAEVGVELVGRVLRRRGEVEEALEDEIEVRVVADDAPVEGFVGIGARGQDVRIVVAEGAEPVDPDRVDPHFRAAGGEPGLETGVQGDGAEGVVADNPARLEVFGLDVSPEEEGAFRVDEVTDVEVGLDAAEPGGAEGSLHGEPVERSVPGPGEAQGLAFGELAEVQFRLRRPFPDEAAQSVGGEAQVGHLEIRDHPVGVRKTGDPSADAAGDVAPQVSEGDVLDGQVIHAPVHLAGEFRAEGIVFQGGSEVGDGLHVEDGPGDVALEADAVEEVVEGFLVPVGHLELRHVQRRAPVVDPEVPDAGHAAADARLSGEGGREAALLPDGDLIRGPRHDEVGELHLPSADQSFDFQVVPVDGIGGDLALFPLEAFVHGEVEHPESEVLHREAVDVEDVAAVFRHFIVVGETEDALEVGGGLLPVSRLDGQVHHESVHFRPVEMQPLLLEEALQGKGRRDAVRAGESIHHGLLRAARVGGIIEDDDVFQDQGVEGIQAHLVEGEVPAELLFNLGDGFLADPGLDLGRLDCDTRGEQRHEQRGEESSGYGQHLVHSGTGSPRGIIRLTYKNRKFL